MPYHPTVLQLIDELQINHFRLAPEQIKKWRHHIEHHSDQDLIITHLQVFFLKMMEKGLAKTALPLLTMLVEIMGQMKAQQWMQSFHTTTGNSIAPNQGEKSYLAGIKPASNKKEKNR